MILALCKFVNRYFEVSVVVGDLVLVVFILFVIICYGW